MLTKKRVLEILSGYKRSTRRKVAAYFGMNAQYSSHLHSLHEFLKSLPDGILSANNLQKINEIIAKETNKESETYKVFAELKPEVIKAQHAQQIREFLSTIAYAAFAKWKELHHFDRCHALVAAADELAPPSVVAAIDRLAPRITRAEKLSYAENILAILYFAVSSYASEYSGYPLFRGVLEGLYNQSVSKILVNAINPQPKTINYWLTGLGLQMFADYRAGANGLYVACYVAGSLLEAAVHTLYDKAKEKQYLQSLSHYPKSEIFLRKLLGDLAFAGGSLIGKPVYDSTTHYIGKILYPPEPPKLINLSDKESEMLVRECQRKDPYATNAFKKRTNTQIQKCHDIAFKILQIDPIAYGNKNSTEKKTEVREAFTKLSIFWHPDKAKANGIDPAIAQEQMVQINLANEALKIKFL